MSEKISEISQEPPLRTEAAHASSVTTIEDARVMHGSTDVPSGHIVDVSTLKIVETHGSVDASPTDTLDELQTLCTRQCDECRLNTYMKARALMIQRIGKFRENESNRLQSALAAGKISQKSFDAQIAGMAQRTIRMIDRDSDATDDDFVYSIIGSPRFGGVIAEPHVTATIINDTHTRLAECHRVNGDGNHLVKLTDQASKHLLRQRQEVLIPISPEKSAASLR